MEIAALGSCAGIGILTLGSRAGIGILALHSQGQVIIPAPLLGEAGYFA